MLHFNVRGPKSNWIGSLSVRISRLIRERSQPDMSTLSTTQPVNRLRNALPRIGIRPTIDGRLGGVRESLEGVTMGMARAAASFISDNVRHSCGLPVECVIADSCIGGVAEAAACAEKF